jgi:biotin synthase
MSASAKPDPLALARRVIEGGEVTREEVGVLFTFQGEDVYDLLYAAHKVRRHFHGDKVTFCSILPTKFGRCSEDCKFCAQSAHFDVDIKPHAMMDAAEVGKACRDARDNGASAFGIVNAGRGPTQREWPKIMEAVHAMKEVDGVCHCATLGTLTEEQAVDLKNAGIRRINHNLETSREFYPQVVTTHTWQERVDTVRLAQKVGLETCCGCIFGMGETIADRVSLAFSLKDLNPSVVPLNFLVPIPGTPLADSPKLRPLEILTIIAVMRLVLPRQDLKVAGGREKNLRDLQSWIFYAGATSGLIGNYLATAGRPNSEDLQMIADLELTWQDDRVGDFDPNIPMTAGEQPVGSSLYALPLLTSP